MRVKKARTDEIARSRMTFTKMNLIMFDVDGTLTQTNSVDTECFTRALREVLRIEGIDTNWANYKHVTDQGCLEELIQIHKGRARTEYELYQVKERYLALLQEKADSDPALFLPTPGAQDMINRLKRNSNVVVVLATGAWLESVWIKVQTAGLMIDGIPIASGNDALSREDIMKIAEAKGRDCSYASFRSKTYVGDAAWDVQAATRLGYSFIGIASGDKAKRLKAEGAKWVIQDFLHDQAFEVILQAIWDAEPSLGPDG